MPLAWIACLPLLLCLAFSAKFVTILVAGSENGSAMASLALTIGFAALAVWLFRMQQVWPRAQPARQPEPARPAPRPASPPSPLRPVLSAPGGVERRRHPRIPVDWPVEIAWSQAVRPATRLHDISRGGARLAYAQPEPAGRHGLLHVPGLTLPVPFSVVDFSPVTGLHIRFDLEGMGLDALEQQLDALLVRG